MASRISYFTRPVRYLKTELIASQILEKKVIFMDQKIETLKISKFVFFDGIDKVNNSCQNSVLIVIAQ